MAHPFNWVQKSNMIQLIVGGTGLIQWDATFQTAQRERSNTMSTVAFHLCPPCLTVPSSLQRFSCSKPKNKNVDLFVVFFFLRKTSVLFLWQLWKLDFKPLSHTCCLLKLVQRGWMLGCICRLPVGSFLRDEVQEWRSTQSASLPWRSAAGKTPATWPGRSGNTWRTRWSRGHACWWTLEERENRLRY